MALTNVEIMDTTWKTIIKSTFSSTNSAATLVDVSGLSGWQTGGLVNISAVAWSTSSPLTLIWAGTSATDAMVLNGNGTYGGSNGFPAISNNAGTPTGDINLTNAAAAVGYLVIVCHKIATVSATSTANAGWNA
ncbi:MAG: hypothetical protein VX237_06270 [Chloroflexota bacterium]|nr:hypothetical protein [Chloroflexota bacterium]